MVYTETKPKYVLYMYMYIQLRIQFKNFFSKNISMSQVNYNLFLNIYIHAAIVASILNDEKKYSSIEI